MYAVAIFLKGREQPIVLHYNAYKNASEAALTLSGPKEDQGRPLGCSVEDDFGHVGHFFLSEVMCPLLSDVDKDLECRIELAKKEQAAQARFNSGPQVVGPSEFMPPRRGH